MYRVYYIPDSISLTISRWLKMLCIPPVPRVIEYVYIRIVILLHLENYLPCGYQGQQISSSLHCGHHTLFPNYNIHTLNIPEVVNVYPVVIRHSSTGFDYLVV